MKIVVSGATSMIGRKFVSYANSNGCEVVSIVRPGSDKKIPKGTSQTVFLDMDDYANIGAAVGKCDCYVHLSWNGTRGQLRMDRKLQHKNLECGISAVKSVIEAGCSCVVTAGSQAEYGPQNGFISENTVCRPNTEYGIAKLAFFDAAYKLCKEDGISFREPRFFSFYGPEDYNGTLIMSLLSKMLLNEPCKMTAGTQMWDYLYIDDGIKALYKLCTTECEDGVYNFGSGDARMLKDFVAEIADITGTKSELLFGAIPYPDTGAVSLWPDVSKLNTALNWFPETSFRSGIEEILKTITV